MVPDSPQICIADIVQSTAGHDCGGLFYVVEAAGEFVLLANGKQRKLEQPKRKKLKHVRMVSRPDSVVAQRLRRGERVLNSELRRDLAYLSRELQSNNLGG